MLLALPLWSCGAPEIPEGQLGLGSYLPAPLPGAVPVQNRDGSAAVPLVTASLTKPVSTHDWWSSLVWPHKGPFSGDLYAHPLVFRADAEGLWVRYPTGFEVTESTYFAELRDDLHLGLSGLTAPDARLAAYGDWTVTAAWEAPSDTMRATFGRGLPYVWVEGAAGSAQISLVEGAAVELNANVAVIRVHGRSFGAFAPPGVVWEHAANVLTAGTSTYSVAVLPDDEPATLDAYQSRAFTVVRDSRVNWAYDQEASAVETSFDLQTEALLGGQSTDTFMALYRHQWLNSADVNTDFRYGSPRGEMQVVSGSSFLTRVTYGGVLPRLPDLCLKGGDAQLADLIAKTHEADEHFARRLGQQDTYWSGKAMGRLSELIPLATAARNEDAATRFTELLRAEVEDWLAVGDSARFFYYEPAWKTLIGSPSSFESDSELNDHHFHYGYHIQAASTLARLDTTWADGWGDMVRLLIKDTANIDRTDFRFPFLRSFDPYAGHSIANGHSDKVGGYDQESSSESMNFSAAIIRWALETNDDELRDLGIWLHATERVAIEQYWFDVDDAVFPPAFDRSTLAILWGRGGSYDTWWSDEPEYIHGINYLPLTGGSYYLGRHPDYVRANRAELEARSDEPLHIWPDLAAMFLALADPGEARAQFNQIVDTYRPEEGESKPHTHQWIGVLEQLGTVDTRITANIPAYRVFHDGKRRAYVAYNPSSKLIKARFSDGAEFSVPPRSQVGVCR
ncbi:MAG: endoglucanase Acf2 [Rhodothermales bacterium]|jgi:endoglucanase Acf2